LAHSRTIAGGDIGGADALVAAVLMANAAATAAGLGLADVDAVRSYRPGSGAEMLAA
jgi:hypothetical protein